jgi:hypothetical protein
VKVVKLKDFVVPLDSVERASGLNLFPELPRRGLGDLCMSRICEI